MTDVRINSAWECKFCCCIIRLISNDQRNGRSNNHLVANSVIFCCSQFHSLFCLPQSSHHKSFFILCILEAFTFFGSLFTAIIRFHHQPRSTSICISDCWISIFCSKGKLFLPYLVFFVFVIIFRLYKRVSAYPANIVCVRSLL